VGIEVKLLYQVLNFLRPFLDIQGNLGFRRPLDYTNPIENSCVLMNAGA